MSEVVKSKRKLLEQLIQGKITPKDFKERIQHCNAGIAIKFGDGRIRWNNEYHSEAEFEAIMARIPGRWIVLVCPPDEE